MEFLIDGGNELKYILHMQWYYFYAVPFVVGVDAPHLARVALKHLNGLERVPAKVLSNKMVPCLPLFLVLAKQQMPNWPLNPPLHARAGTEPPHPEGAVGGPGDGEVAARHELDAVHVGVVPRQPKVGVPGETA